VAELAGPQLPFPMQPAGRWRRPVQLGQQLGGDPSRDRAADRRPPVLRQSRQLQPHQRGKFIAGHQTTSKVGR
jgi:hypothetical protein